MSLAAAEGGGKASNGVVQAEHALARATVFLRVGGLVEIVIASWMDFPRYPSGLAVAGLIAAVVTESGLLITVCLRTGKVPTFWIPPDVVFCTVAVVIGAAVTAPTDYGTWANFMYPFSIITSFGIGVAFRRLPVALAMASLLVCGYLISAITVHVDPVWNVLPNSLTYLVNMIVAWAIARYLLTSARESDVHRAEMVQQAAELAREKERARHARILHDRVLQTLETLARGRWLTDAGFKAHIAAEAAWLRALVEGVDLERESDLLTALQLLVQRKAETGLQVEWNNTQLREGGRWRYTLRPEMIAAIVDATGEALTNVEKHAGVDTAVVRASVGERELTVSVLDQGCGFDLGLVHRGVGLDTSIRARIAEQGGRVRIESAPGTGTYVEIVLPLGTTEECGTHDGHNDTILPT